MIGYEEWDEDEESNGFREGFRELMFEWMLKFSELDDGCEIFR